MMQGEAVPAVLAALVVVPALSGCLQAGGTPVPVPAPREGATYTYESRRGDRLTVRVDGTGNRVDGFLRDHEGVLFNWTYREPTTGFTYYFEEAVDRATGWTIQHVAMCEGPKDLDGDDDRRCLDEHASVSFALGGLPGAFGAAPFWGSTVVSTDRTTVETRPYRWEADRQGFSWGDAELAYEVHPTTVEGLECVELAADGFVGGPDRDEAHLVSLYPQPVVWGPFTLCEGLSLPVRFTSLDGTRYKMVSWDQRGSPIELEGSGDVWGSEGRPVPMRSVEPPLLVADPSADSPFPTREAHRKAQERVEVYAQLFEQDPPALLAESWWFKSGESYIPTEPVNARNTTWHTRRLTAFGQDGRGVFVEIRKKIERTPLGRTVNYSIEEVRNVTREVVPERDRYRDRQARLAPTIELGRNITGQPLSNLRVRVESSTYHSEWWSAENVRVNRSDGYINYIFYRDPTLVKTGMLRIEHPYRLIVDGPSGGILWLSLNRSRLPVGQWV